MPTYNIHFNHTSKDISLNALIIRKLFIPFVTKRLVQVYNLARSACDDDCIGTTYIVFTRKPVKI